MTAIDIRPAVSNDIKPLILFSHQSETTHTWQIESNYDQGQIDVSFKRIQLPRLVKLEYTRDPNSLLNSWTKRDLFLIARIDSIRCGYLTLKIIESKVGRIVDLVVDEPFRRQGVATALLIAAQDWLRMNELYQMTLEMQIKNEAATTLAEKLGFVFSGFVDRYFGNREIAVFYTLFFR